MGFLTLIDSNGVVNKDFRLEATSDNAIFKVYKNGDVYGRGLEGVALGTPKSKVINYLEWEKLKIPSYIPNPKKIISVVWDSMMIIDENDELWVWGNAVNKDKFGLSEYEKKLRYLYAIPTKINVDNKKVSRVYSDYANTYVITKNSNGIEDSVYVVGQNLDGCLGVGNTNPVTRFTKINISNVQDIEKIVVSYRSTLIKYKNNTYMFCGSNAAGQLGIGTNLKYSTFTSIWTDTTYLDVSQIKQMSYLDNSLTILKKDGTMWQAGNNAYGGYNDLPAGKTNLFRKFSTSISENVEKIYYSRNGRILLKNNNGQKEVWASSHITYKNVFCLNTVIDPQKYSKLIIQNDKGENIENEIKEIYPTVYAIYYIINDGSVYASGRLDKLGINSSSLEYTTKIVKVEIPVKIIKSEKKVHEYSEILPEVPMLYDENNNIYVTSRSFYTNKIENNFTKIASNTSYFFESSYVKDNNLYTTGEPAARGMNSITTERLYEYTKNPNASILNNVKDTMVTGTDIFVKTNDNKLYVSGKNTNLSADSYLGIESREPEYNFVKILDNISLWNIQYGNLLISDNKLYGFGRYGSALGLGDIEDVRVPTIVTTPINDLSKAEYLFTSRYASYIIADGGTLYATGNNEICNIGMEKTSTFKKHNFDFNSEKLVKIVTDFRGTWAIAITDKGNVYGWGEKHILGINEYSGIQETPIKLNVTNAVDITCGDGFVVITTKDGKVYGTGKNTLGVLGKYIDEKGNAVSINNQSTLNWVRCVELEN